MLDRIQMLSALLDVTRVDFKVQKYEEYFIRQKNIPTYPGKGVFLQRFFEILSQ